MDSFKVKVENTNVILRYIRRITSLFRFIELCTFFFIISTIFSTLSAQYYFKRLYITPVSPFFIFLLGNAIVIILFLLISPQSSTKDDSTVVDYKACIIPSGRQIKRKMYRSQSDKLMNTEEPNNNRVLRRSATIACGRYSEKKSPAEMTDEEFRCTVEAFIARQQKFLREEEFSAVVSTET